MRLGRLFRETLRRDLLEAATYKTYALSRVLGLLGLLFSAYFVARTFAGHEPPSLSGQGGYFGFLIVGVMASDLAWALFAGPADRVRQAQLAGTLEAELASPVPTPAWLLAQSLFPVLGALLRASLGAGLALAVAGMFPEPARWPGLLLAVTLTLAALLPPSASWAARSRSCSNAAIPSAAGCTPPRCCSRASPTPSTSSRRPCNCWPRSCPDDPRAAGPSRRPLRRPGCVCVGRAGRIRGRRRPVRAAPGARPGPRRAPARDAGPVLIGRPICPASAPADPAGRAAASCCARPSSA
jgi:hypothetical protein